MGTGKLNFEVAIPNSMGSIDLRGEQASIQRDVEREIAVRDQQNLRFGWDSLNDLPDPGPNGITWAQTEQYIIKKLTMTGTNFGVQGGGTVYYCYSDNFRTCYFPHGLTISGSPWMAAITLSTNVIVKLELRAVLVFDGGTPW